MKVYCHTLDAFIFSTFLGPLNQSLLKRSSDTFSSCSDELEQSWVSEHSSMTLTILQRQNSNNTNIMRKVTFYFFRHPKSLGRPTWDRPSDTYGQSFFCENGKLKKILTGTVKI